VPMFHAAARWCEAPDPACLMCAARTGKYEFDWSMIQRWISVAQTPRYHTFRVDASVSRSGALSMRFGFTKGRAETGELLWPP